MRGTVLPAASVAKPGPTRIPQSLINYIRLITLSARHRAAGGVGGEARPDPAAPAPLACVEDPVGEGVRPYPAAIRCWSNTGQTLVKHWSNTELGRVPRRDTIEPGGFVSRQWRCTNVGLQHWCNPSGRIEPGDFCRQKFSPPNPLPKHVARISRRHGK